MTAKFVLFKDEDFDESTGEPVGKVWIVRSEEDDEEELRDEWMLRSEAKKLAEEIGYPFELEGTSMTDEEVGAFKRERGLALASPSAMRSPPYPLSPDFSKAPPPTKGSQRPFSRPAALAAPCPRVTIRIHSMPVHPGERREIVLRRSFCSYRAWVSCWRLRGPRWPTSPQCTPSRTSRETCSSATPLCTQSPRGPSAS